MMLKLRDSSEVKEAASLLGELLQQTAAEDAARTGFRGERIQRELRQLCARAGFEAACLCDQHGLPLAIHDMPIAEETIAALATVLGGALARTCDIADWPNAASLSIDIDYQDKLVLRTFIVDEIPYYLLVQCSQETDERSDLELSVEQIAAIITKPRMRQETTQ
jgi:hypothetical protein